MTDKLEIGSFATVRPGWLCTDINPQHPDIQCLDATQPFPFADDTFQFIYAEHMIEHITFPQARSMLNECHRVMQPGGVIRIVTPSIEFLSLMLRDSIPDYVQWAAKTFCPNDPPLRSVVFNNFVRAWGHQFIYDASALCWIMHQAGFQDLQFCSLQKSEHPELQNLAFEDRMPQGFLAIESMVIEGTK
jgi:predicted SAM-dependent methyltransferase